MCDLFTKKIMVLDGATGTRLQEYGLGPSDCTPAWILKHPEALRAVKKSYVEAGSDMLYAPTFGATSVDLKKHRIKESVLEINKNLVELAREESGNLPVGGDIAPTGLLLYPMGDTTFDELVDIYTEQADALEEAGVDFFAIETQMSLAECRAAVIAVRTVSEKPILTSFSCNDNGKTLYGEDLHAALLCLQDMGVDAFGINCCGNQPLIHRVISRLSSRTLIPLLVKPNAGTPITTGNRTRYSMSATRMGNYVPKFLNAGARLLGGCCGTDAAYIAAIREAVDAVPNDPFAPSDQKLWAASSFRVVELTSRMKIEELAIDEDIVENAAISEEIGTKLLKVVIRDEMDVDTLAEAQFSIRLPLAVRFEDHELCTRFLHLYHGKPILL